MAPLLHYSRFFPVPTWHTNLRRLLACHTFSATKLIPRAITAKSRNATVSATTPSSASSPQVNQAPFSPHPHRPHRSLLPIPLAQSPATAATSTRTLPSRPSRPPTHPALTLLLRLPARPPTSPTIRPQSRPRTQHRFPQLRIDTNICPAPILPHGHTSPLLPLIPLDTLTTLQTNHLIIDYQIQVSTIAALCSRLQPSYATDTPMQLLK